MDSGLKDYPFPLEWIIYIFVKNQLFLCAVCLVT